MLLDYLFMLWKMSNMGNKKKRRKTAKDITTELVLIPRVIKLLKNK